MRWVLTLAILIGLVGGAYSQSQPSFLGEGYSTTQLMFFNGQNTIDFQPIVEKYWNSYIQNGESSNPAVNNQSTAIDIWLNSFPLDFNKEVQLKSSSFVANPSVATNLSSSELQSAALTRDINYNFNLDQSWKYTSGPISSVSAASSSGVPPKSSQGQIISQGIISLF